MKKAIVYIDLSERSKQVLEYVMHLRRFIPLEVHLVYNINIYEYAISSGLGMGIPYADTLDTILLDDRNEIKQKIHRFIEESSCWGKTELKENLKIETGELFGSLKNVKSLRHNFVIIPELDKENFVDQFFGMDKFEVLDYLNIPLLMVPNDYHFNIFKSILFLTDFHKDDLDAIRFVSRLALPIKAPIRVIHITPKKDLILLEKMRQLKNNVETNLRTHAALLSYEIIESNKFAQSVDRITHDKEVSLLVIQAILLKSCKEKLSDLGVLKFAKLPVLIFKKD
ncbi:hypothetical protein [Flexithrix dorotheae]|uniref:hypothetical protein n=1 Tax=Flexithrix dorotheae TaxID=70993 RepID=UPI00037FE5A7|nr:hypothetical protein [Flexithrix dorotheae]